MAHPVVDYATPAAFARPRYAAVPCVLLIVSGAGATGGGLLAFMEAGVFPTHTRDLLSSIAVLAAVWGSMVGIISGFVSVLKGHRGAWIWLGLNLLCFVAAGAMLYWGF